MCNAMGAASATFKQQSRMKEEHYTLVIESEHTFAMYFSPPVAIDTTSLCSSSISSTTEDPLIICRSDEKHMTYF